MNRFHARTMTRLKQKLFGVVCRSNIPTDLLLDQNFLMMYEKHPKTL